MAKPYDALEAHSYTKIPIAILTDEQYIHNWRSMLSAYKLASS